MSDCAVLISIKPKWCDKIASGEKTIEVRKTRPKLETPFKCYIYCTKPAYPHEDFIFTDGGEGEIRGFYGGGKVIGEFVCDAIWMLAPVCHAPDDVDVESLSQLTTEQIVKYLRGKGYGWHISDLKIYDEPKELCSFQNLGFRRAWEEYSECEARFGEIMEVIPPDPKHYSLKRPPQSWQFVEELK